MITRLAQTRILSLLQRFSAVAILGPRQIGKTTLARAIARDLQPHTTYLDLEKPSDLAKLKEPELYFHTQTHQLMIIDEIQRFPQLFQILRSVIDERRHQGHKNKQFLLLGSASLDLLQQSSESLAGRIIYQELSGLLIPEIIDTVKWPIETLWLRGGFPDSLLAESDSASFEWRLAFIRTYLERDIPQLGVRIPAEMLRRLWTMLSHSQGTLLNNSRLAENLGLSVPTITRYLGLLNDLLLLRYLKPWSNNLGKRLVKTPKIYLRDSGLVHVLLGIQTQDDLLSHPIIGNSWEAFVIENILATLPETVHYWFYRTQAGAEIDLILEMNHQSRIAIEIKRSLTPTVSAGFYNGYEDIKAYKGYVVYPGEERFPLSATVEAIPLSILLEVLASDIQKR